MAAAATTPASTTTQLRGFRLREMQTTTSDKTFHLKWNNHLQNLSQLFTAIYSSSALADVTLSCRDGAIRAHKLVLSACSPYFEQIFRDNPCKHPVIILKGIPYAEINLLVEFMYKGSVDVQEIDLQSLMHTASELEIRGLAYELRKDASSLLNVNLNEFPSQSSNADQKNSFSSVDIASHSNDSPHQNNVSRLQQIHLYQQSMCRSGYSNQQVNPSCFEVKRKRKSEEPMPATTTTAVKNILAAAAKELAEKKTSPSKSKSSTSIQTEDEDLDMKVETYESDSGEGELPLESEELPHGRDTRFKGKKRVSVGLDDEYVPVRGSTKNVNKQNKKNVKLTFKTPNSSNSPTNDISDDPISKVVISAITSGDGSTQIPTTGLLKCVNLDNLRENPRESVTIIDDDDSSAVDTSDENNLLVETAYESAPGPDDDYDSSDSKPFRKVDEKLYKCDLCNLSFVRKFHMKRHRRIHTGERPFQCDDCPFSFNRSSHLARHRRTHTGERPYRCEACGRTFTRGDKLKLHLRVCEKDEYVLPSHLNADDRKQPKSDVSQAVLPGMVSIGHSERHQLMFTSSGDVLLAPRSQSQSQSQIQSDADPNTTSEINESNQSLLMMNDSNASQLNLSAMATPSTSDTSMLANQFFSLDALGYPIKRGRGRPRKKPLPVDVPLVKKKRGRPPKVIKLDPNEPPTPAGPVENYNASNLPYGDFSYLTDIISTHFNQTNQAYQNMIQLNPAAAANLLSTAVAQMHGGAASILVNPNPSNTDVKSLASNVLSQNNKLIATSQSSNLNESAVSTESKPSDAAGSSAKIETVQVNNENAVPNDASKSENMQNENAESDNKLIQNDETSKEGESRTVKLPNLPNTTVDIVTTNNESSVVPLTVGECTIKAISNN